MKQVLQRYAIALFSLALEENRLEDYFAESQQLLEIFETNEAFVELIKNEVLTAEEKKEIIFSVFEKYCSKNFLYFMYVLIDHHREPYLKEILKEFIQLCFNHFNIKQGMVYSTTSLSQKQIKQLEKKTSLILQAKVQLQNQIQKDLIGGFKIEVDGWVLDYSIQQKMKQMKSSLMTNRKENKNEKKYE